MQQWHGYVYKLEKMKNNNARIQIRFKAVFDWIRITDLKLRECPFNIGGGYGSKSIKIRRKARSCIIYSIERKIYYGYFGQNSLK